MENSCCPWKYCLFKKQKQTYLENVQIIDSSVLICSFQEAKKKINTFSWRCMCSAACQAVVLLVRLQGWVVLAGASVSGDWWSQSVCALSPCQKDAQDAAPEKHFSKALFQKHNTSKEHVIFSYIKIISIWINCDLSYKKIFSPHFALCCLDAAWWVMRRLGGIHWGAWLI